MQKTAKSYQQTIQAEIFGKTNSQRAGLQTLKDPVTDVIETEPAKVARII
jgi:hypothetical protein